MMARKAQKGLGDKHKSILEVLQRFNDEFGYPPSIREICTEADISSTSVANYYLERLEKLGYIERDRRVSRGLRLLKFFNEMGEVVDAAAQSLQESIEELLRVPIVGRIVASEPLPMPTSTVTVRRKLSTRVGSS